MLNILQYTVSKICRQIISRLHAPYHYIKIHPSYNFSSLGKKKHFMVNDISYAKYIIVTDQFQKFKMEKIMHCQLFLFSHSVMSDSLQPHGLQHARLPCPSLSPRACSNSCSLSWCCHPTILPSVIPFSCLQFFPASWSFLMSQLFTSGGQNIGVSASASVLP